MKADERNFVDLIRRGREEGILYVIEAYGGLLQSIVKKEAVCLAGSGGRVYERRLPGNLEEMEISEEDSAFEKLVDQELFRRVFLWEEEPEAAGKALGISRANVYMRWNFPRRMDGLVTIIFRLGRLLSWSSKKNGSCCRGG